MTWETLHKELQREDFYNYILELKDAGTLEKELPEVFALIDTPERLDYHPEGNSFDHTILALKQVQYFKDKSRHDIMNFCLMCHDLGKALTPKNILPKHIGHDYRGLSVINPLCERLQVPKEYRHKALYVCNYHMDIFTMAKRKPAKLYKLIKDLTYEFTSFEDLSVLLICSKCDVLGRLGEVNDKAGDLRYIYLLAFNIYTWAKSIMDFSLDLYTEQEMVKSLSSQLPQLKEVITKSLTKEPS